MDNIFSLLDKDTLELIKTRKAKEDKTILEHTEDLLKELDILLNLGYISDSRIYNLVKIAIVYHDVGKLNEEFQKRIMSRGNKFNELKEVNHNILSLYFIDKDKFQNIDDYIRVAHAVFNHHYYCNNYIELTEKQDIIEKLLDGFNTVKIKKRVKSQLATIVEDKDAIKIKGYLHRCDYSASSDIVIEYPNKFLRSSLDNLLNEWKKKNSKAKWNELQEFCIKNTDENIIGIAQTGMGKTEGGLLWIGDNKGFFLLPLRTAINAIYDRVKNDIIKKENINERISILHSSALEYYLKNVDKEYGDNDIIEYYKTGKQLSIPLNIGTMDSMFDFVFKYPGYETKLTTLSYSKIVIDEIQSYGPDLLAYLVYGLEKIYEQGGKIAILTATLPPFVKDILKRNINFKESDKPFINDMNRHSVKVIDNKIDYKDIEKKYLENKLNKRSNKILVVCNTIKKSQEIYEKLKECTDISSEEINILHSKFIKIDRAKKEKSIIDFGKTYDYEGNIDKKEGIWISTSIVEASLDIDFDYIFTELQDLNSLFQRFGRCNRKGVKKILDYNCYVYCNIDDSLFIDGDKGFIDKDIFEISKKAIGSINGTITEEDKIRVINEYLTTDNIKGSNYMRKFNEIYDYIRDIPPYRFNSKDNDLRNILSEDIIPGPIYERYYGEIKEIEEKLLSFDLKVSDRVRLKDNLLGYTVSVYPNDVRSYEYAIRNNKAISYNRVKLGRHKGDYINVIDCIYDDGGYKRKKFNELNNNSIML